MPHSGGNSPCQFQSLDSNHNITAWNRNPNLPQFSTSSFHTGKQGSAWDAADESFVIHRRERERERQRERERGKGEEEEERVGV
jgi:hypothetical protein